MKKQILFTFLLLTSGCADKLYSVNKEINSYRYMPDKINYMKSGQEFLQDGGGDCEDFAEAKREELIRQGVPEENIKFVLIPKEKKTGKSHAVLEVNGFILDNMTNSLTLGVFTKGYRITYESMLIVARKSTLAGN